MCVFYLWVFNVSLADRTSMAALKMCVDSSIVGVKIGNLAKFSSTRWQSVRICLWNILPNLTMIQTLFSRLNRSENDVKEEF